MGTPQVDQVNCLETGKCTIHDVEIERRKTDRKDIEYLKAAVTKLEAHIETVAIELHKRINAIVGKVVGIFVSLGLIAAITFGSFYYTGTVDKRNDRGEEILLNKINANDQIRMLEQRKIVDQIVTLLTADAEQKEWQRGMMKQLETLNENMRIMLRDTHIERTPPHSFYDRGE